MKEEAEYSCLDNPTANHLSEEKHKSELSCFLRSEEVIFGVSFISAFALLRLPYEKIDGNPIPTIIFKNRPSLFHAFVLGIDFSFTSAVLAITLRLRNPKAARCFRLLAVISLSIFVGILIALTLPLALKFAASTSGHQASF